VSWAAFCIAAALVVVALCIAFVAGMIKAQKDAVLREENEVTETDEGGSGNYW